VTKNKALTCLLAVMVGMMRSYQLVSYVIISTQNSQAVKKVRPMQKKELLKVVAHKFA